MEGEQTGWVIQQNVRNEFSASTCKRGTSGTDLFKDRPWHIPFQMFQIWLSHTRKRGNSGTDFVKDRPCMAYSISNLAVTKRLYLYVMFAALVGL